MELIYQLDQTMIDSAGPEQRLVQKLFSRATGAANAAVSWIQTPAGEGSPDGLHFHDFDQIFYVLSGEMHVEQDGVVTVVGPGGLVVFPKGCAHRNWNDGVVPTRHLSITAPAPDPSLPFSHELG